MTNGLSATLWTSSEVYLWLFLLFWTLLSYTWDPALLVTLIQFILRCSLRQDGRSPLTASWRNLSRYGDVQGAAMGIILPIVLLTVLEEPELAMATALVSISGDWPALPVWMAIGVYYIVVDAVAWSILPYTALSMILYPSIRHLLLLKGVFTAGEWRLVVVLLSLAMVACFTRTSADHVTVALSGVLGCLLGCTLAQGCRQLPVQLVLSTAIPLASVELALSHNVALPKPRCLSWLWIFLLEPENYNPRYYWLLYWAVVVAVTVPLSPTSTSTVLARKWFHAIAILLFAPPTVFAPELLSLSYAIALAVLMVGEGLRRQLPLVDDFYRRYLDDSKDRDTLIVSHMALVVGCAMPLWMAEYLALEGRSFTTLASIGVLVLGVGDAMGAVIGSQYGRLPWGASRTIEGSFAMLLSMLVVCWVADGIETMLECFPALLVTTLLEAFTVQIDNLVLPLAGAAVWLLCR